MSGSFLEHGSQAWGSFPCLQGPLLWVRGSGSLWEFDQSRVSLVPAGVSLGGRHPSWVCPCVLGSFGALQTHSAQIPNGIKERANPGGLGSCTPPVSQVISRKVRSRSETNGSHSSSGEWGWEWVEHGHFWGRSWTDLCHAGRTNERTC